MVIIDGVISFNITRTFFHFIFRQREKETTRKGKKYYYHVIRTEAEVSYVTAFQIFPLLFVVL